MTTIASHYQKMTIALGNANKHTYLHLVIKGQLILKANCQAVNSSKKQKKELVFTTMRHVFVHFLEESLARKKMFRDYLIFRKV